MSGWLFTTFVALGSLVSMTGLKQFFLWPLDDTILNAIWFLIQVSPLLLPLPGLMSGQVRATFIVCLASQLYFIHGVLAMVDEPTRLYGAVEITFALMLCGSTTMLVRALRERDAMLEHQRDTDGDKDQVER